MENIKKENESKINLPIMVVPFTPQYVNPTPGELPLMAIGTPSGKQEFDAETLAKMKNCGMNIAENILSNNADVITQSILNGDAVGVKIMVRLSINKISVCSGTWDNVSLKENNLPLVSPSDTSWSSFYLKWNNVVTKFKNHSAVAGWMIVDEPTVSDFWVVAECTKRIYENVMNGDYSTAKKMLVFNNLLKNNIDLVTGSPSADEKNKNTRLFTLSGGFSTEKVVSCYTGVSQIKSYSDYLNLYCRLNGPSVLSVDAYPFSGLKYHYENSGIAVDISETNKKRDENLQSYYLTLMSFRDQNIPFWSTVQTTVESTLESIESLTQWVDKYPKPSLATIRYQAFTALSFGAVGLSFWRFSDDKARENIKWTESPLNASGINTPTFDYLKTVVDQIKEFQHIFLNATSVNPALTEVKELSESVAGGDKSEENYIVQPQKTPGINIIKLKDGAPTTTFSFIKSIKCSIFLDETEEVDGVTVVKKTDSPYGVLLSQIHTDKYEYLIVVNLNPEEDCFLEMSFTTFVNDEMKPSPGGSNRYIGMIEPGDWHIFSRKK
ncbi:MAG: hypothetical protein HDS80_04345 [Bacteroidales bacterium]|nr:hypothetical protein [Bacteroidales bacterium]